MTHLSIGTRGSELAMWQAEHVRAALVGAHPGLQVELEVIRTKGVIIKDGPLARVGDRGLFIKEIETALLEKRIDFAEKATDDGKPSEGKDAPTADDLKRWGMTQEQYDKIKDRL